MFAEFGKPLSPHSYFAMTGIVAIVAPLVREHPAGRLVTVVPEARRRQIEDLLTEKLKRTSAAAAIDA